MSNEEGPGREPWRNICIALTTVIVYPIVGQILCFERQDLPGFIFGLMVGVFLLPLTSALFGYKGEIDMSTH